MTTTTAHSTLVIGGTGFVGYHTILELLSRGHSVTALALDLPVKDLLPSEVRFVRADVAKVSDGELVEIFTGHDCIVYAAGADDRTIPPRPAYPFFHLHNVETVGRVFGLARKAGIGRGVVCSSYFAYFNRMHPEWNLAQHHPYIRSRQAQAEAAFAAGGESLSVCVLELPYIFGSVPGRRPLWSPLIAYLRSPWPLFYTRGGTNMVSVKRVADAIAGGLERGEHGRSYPVGGENRTWPELLEPLARLVGKKKRVWTVPTFIVSAMMVLVWLYHRLKGQESGLHPTTFVHLQTRLTYFDPKPAQDALGFGSDGLDEALQDTVDACR